MNSFSQPAAQRGVQSIWQLPIENRRAFLKSMQNPYNEAVSELVSRAYIYIDVCNIYIYCYIMLYYIELITYCHAIFILYSTILYYIILYYIIYLYI